MWDPTPAFATSGAANPDYEPAQSSFGFLEGHTLTRESAWNPPDNSFKFLDSGSFNPQSSGTFTEESAQAPQKDFGFLDAGTFVPPAVQDPASSYVPHTPWMESATPVSYEHNYKMVFGGKCCGNCERGEACDGSGPAISSAASSSWLMVGLRDTLKDCRSKCERWGFTCSAACDGLPPLAALACSIACGVATEACKAYCKATGKYVEPGPLPTLPPAPEKPRRGPDELDCPGDHAVSIPLTQDCDRSGPAAKVDEMKRSCEREMWEKTISEVGKLTRLPDPKVKCAWCFHYTSGGGRKSRERPQRQCEVLAGKPKYEWKRKLGAKVTPTTIVCQEHRWKKWPDTVNVTCFRAMKRAKWPIRCWCPIPPVPPGFVDPNDVTKKPPL